MKHKTAELEGVLLDAAVALAEGFDEFWWSESRKDFIYDAGPQHHMPLPRMTEWQNAGPIIDRERIGLLPPIYGITDKWATTGFSSYGEGQTALIAAMRAYVASRFGEEVELP